MAFKELYGGIILIIVGVCIRLFPSIIARLDILLKELKFNIQMEKSKTILGNAFIVLGVTLVAMKLTFSYLLLDEIAEAVIPMFVPVFIVVVGAVLVLPTLKKD